MKFEIFRTSDYSSKPCDEAHAEVWELEIIKPFRPGADWNVTEHIERTIYFCEVNSIEDLLDLIDKYGEVVVSKLDSLEEIEQTGARYSIEIYDSWRE